MSLLREYGCQPRPLVIAVFGISGVGKTSIIREYLSEDRSAVHLNAGELLGSSRRNLAHGVASSMESIIESQWSIVEKFTSVKNETGRGIILFDAHSVIDRNGITVPVPVDVIAALGLDGILLVLAKEEEILKRRAKDASKWRPIYPIGKIIHLQRSAVEACQFYATALSVPMIKVWSGALGDFAMAVQHIKHIAEHCGPVSK
jgi:adenylate kinase